MIRSQRRAPRLPAAPTTAGLSLLLVASFALAAAAPTAAQVVPIDEASFRLLRNGSVIGQEALTIHRLGLGGDARALGQSEIRLDDGTQARPRLEATPDLQANTYRNEFTGREDAEVAVSRVGRRFVVQSRSPAGESQREYPASGSTAVLEPEIVLLYYFLQPWLGSDGAELTALDPRASQRHRVTVSILGTEEVRVGRNPVSARHLRLEGTEVRWEVWIDEEGRILRASVPDTEFQAERLPG